MNESPRRWFRAISATSRSASGREGGPPRVESGAFAAAALFAGFRGFLDAKEHAKDVARGEPEKAREVVEGFVRDHPEIAAGQSILAGMLMRTGQLDEAEEPTLFGGQIRAHGEELGAVLQLRTA